MDNSVFRLVTDSTGAYNMDVKFKQAGAIVCIAEIIPEGQIRAGGRSESVEISVDQLKRLYNYVFKGSEDGNAKVISDLTKRFNRLAAELDDVHDQLDKLRTI
jgi:hypothetical protein